MSTLAVGDYVTIGPDDNRKMTWQIRAIRQADPEHVYATIRSGGYGITKVIPLERLHLWNPKEKK